MPSTQQQQVALAHAAMEQALYFLDHHAPQRALPYLEFASRQFRALEGNRETLR